MDTPWTPGPWDYHGSIGGWVDVLAPPAGTSAPGHDGAWNIVGRFDGMLPTEADLRLIAAAPEMAALLEEVAGAEQVQISYKARALLDRIVPAPASPS